MSIPFTLFIRMCFYAEVPIEALLKKKNNRKMQYFHEFV